MKKIFTGLVTVFGLGLVWSEPVTHSTPSTPYTRTLLRSDDQGETSSPPGIVASPQFQVVNPQKIDTDNQTLTKPGLVIATRDDSTLGGMQITNIAKLTAAQELWDGLPKPWQNPTRQPGMITIACIGDSVGASKMHYLARHAVAAFGFNGYINRGYGHPSALSPYGRHAYGAGGTYESTKGNAPWASCAALPNGGRIDCGYMIPTGELVTDTIGVGYVAGPNQGTFTIRVSRSGAGWVDLATVDASTSTGMEWTDFKTGPLSQRYRIENATGTNLITGHGMWNTATNGIRVCFMDNVTGCDVSTAANRGWFGIPQENNLTNYLSAMDIDLCLVEFKDIQTMTTNDIETGFARVAGMLDAAGVGAVVWVGSTPDSHGNEIWQDPIAQSVASTWGQTFWSAKAHVATVAEMTALGWFNRDTVHPTDSAQEWLTIRMMKDLGLDDWLECLRQRKNGELLGDPPSL